MIRPRRSVVLIGAPGQLRDSLRALLSALRQIELIAESDSITAAMETIESRHPDFVVLIGDSDAEDRIAGLRQIQIRSPQTQRIVFVETVGRKQVLEAPNAEAILLHGTPAAELVSLFERLGQDPRVGRFKVTAHPRVMPKARCAVRRRDDGTT